MTGQPYPPVKPCPGCGAAPSLGAQIRIGSTFKHCESSTCTWAKCPTCKTVWHPTSGTNFRE